MTESLKKKGSHYMAADSHFIPLPYQPKQATRVRTASRSHAQGRTESSVQISYFNHTDRAIAITERDGNVNILHPTGRTSTDEIIVCIKRVMSRDVMERSLETLKQDSRGDDIERDQWVKAFEAALYNKNNLTLEASVEYVIYHRDLADAGGRCYMPDLDLLVEWLSDRGASHPFCLAQRNRSTMQSIVPEVSDTTFMMMIKAVDNSSVSRRYTRYVNIGGEVYQIPVERDLNYQTGVYLVTRRPVTDGEVLAETYHKSFTFEEADKVFSLQRSVEDALTGGPIEAMARAMVELHTATRKVEEVKLRGDQLEQDEKLQRLRNDGAIAKAEQEKDTFSKRNYVEWAKTIAGVLGAIVTIYGIWQKLKAPK